MRWDDLEILRKIDELEESSPGTLNNAWTLMHQMRASSTIRHGVDDRDFARELMMANDAGYITWRDFGERNIAPTDQVTNAGMWLQEHTNIRLTGPGRDRARCRVFELPPPDPEEDDGRPITGRTLDELAQSIVPTFTTKAQLHRFLSDSGIPEEWLDSDSADGAGYISSVLDRLQEGGSEARRILRIFIGQWLDGDLCVPPADDARRRIVALLGRQGWHVYEGRLVIGERTRDSDGVLTPKGRDVRLAGLHPTIREVARPYVESEHPGAAIFEAAKAVSVRVKQMSGLDIDGTDLMAKAFGGDTPRILLGDLSTTTGRDEQEGYRLIFMGTMRAIRNPKAHEPFENLPSDEAFERLGLLSLLMHKLDEAAARTAT
jgi:uncharacterized protein (TIGR02391 family)